VYKSWVNQTESETGQAAGLPYDVTQVQSVFPQITKGTASRDGYFFEGLKILIITFRVSADGFQGLLKAFHFPIQL
jgi:hypothetical protein